MKAKRTEVLNLTHAGLYHAGLPTTKVVRIYEVSKSTIYKVKKCDSAERAQILTPLNKKG